ncbi:MAG: hypothetical protein ACR2OC_04855 [Solirubrobacterales bacterium]
MKPPRRIHDLYSDMRDRRLLPLVAVLLVAIVAVPVLLKTEPTPPPTADPAAEAAALDTSDIPTAPAVLASNPGLRDYRERLEALREKNPFAQDFKIPKANGSALQDVSETSAGAVASVPATGASDASADAAPASAPAADTSAPDSSGVGTAGATTEVTEVTEVQIRHELDVEVDGPNDKRNFEGVEELDTLPGKKTPLLVYVGVTDDEKKAVFLISENVTMTTGDGSCSPSRSDCQLLTLAEGEQRKLFYASSNAPAGRYVVKLHTIDRVVEELK